MCTNIKLVSEDSNIFFGRTNDLNVGQIEEIGITPDIQIVNIPKSITVKSQIKNWESKYSVLGVCNIAETPLNDGINEHGLIGESQTLFESSRAKYSQIIEEGKTPVLGEEFVTFILTQFKNVEEIRNNYENFALVEEPYKYKGIEFHYPLHYTFLDQSGDGIVLEAVYEGQFKLYEYIDVMTNSPEYDYHLTNIKNYIGLDNVGVANKTFHNGYVLDPIENGTGYGLFGVPGDYTSPSRFVRAFNYKNMIEKFHSTDGINQLYRVFNSLIIPKGFEHKDKNSSTSDYSLYWSGYDLTNRKVYVQSASNLSISSKKLDTSLKEITYFDINQSNNFVEL